MADLAWCALVDAELRRMTGGSYDQFLDDHNAEMSPYDRCICPPCIRAREAADAVVRTLGLAGFEIVEIGDD